MTRPLAVGQPEPNSFADLPPGAVGLHWIAWAVFLGATPRREILVTNKSPLQRPRRSRYAHSIAECQLSLIALRPGTERYGGFPQINVLARAPLDIFAGDDPDASNRCRLRAEALLLQLSDPLLMLPLLATRAPPLKGRRRS